MSATVTGTPCPYRTALCLIGALFFGMLASRPALAQNDDAPRVERIRFEGNDYFDSGILLESIVSEQTRCRGFLFQPFCWLSDARLFNRREYLDAQEVVRDELRLEVFYFRQGFRRAQAASEVLPRGDGVEIVFHISEGSPTLIESIEVEQTTEVLSDRALERAELPREEDRLNLVQIDESLLLLQDVLAEDGYLDAVVEDSISVNDDASFADVRVRINPGPRSIIGEVQVSGNENLSAGTISQSLRLNPGDVLRASDLVAAQRALYESNLFHEARVGVEETPDSVKNVDIRVREAPPRSFRVVTGFNTVEFAQAEARIIHYNFLGGARRVEARALVGNLFAAQLNDRGLFLDVLPEGALETSGPFVRPTWQASIDFMQPAFASAYNTLGLAVFAHRRTVPGVVVDRGYGAEVSITRRLDYDMPVSIGYQFEVTTVEAGDVYFCVNYGVCDPATISAVRGRHTLSPAMLSFFADRANDPMAPTMGYRARLDLEHASKYTASDYRYNRVSGSASYYYPLDVARQRVLAGHIRAGWVRPSAQTRRAIGLGDDAVESPLHPRKRFYAGGSRSLRGYGENQFGPKILTISPDLLMEGDEEGEERCSAAEIQDASCDPAVAPMDDFLPRPLGARAVIEASVEYRRPLFGSFVGAVFVDAGTISEDPARLFGSGTIAVTPGFGVRFTSPVGPIRLDLGIKPGLTQQLRVITERETTEGERQLVRLDQRRRYNPAEAAGGGFFREVLSRIAIHLSIGEAF